MNIILHFLKSKANFVATLAAMVLFMLPTYLNAQCTGAFTIFTEDFEDHGNTANGGSGRYTSTNDFYDTASDDDYFGRVQGSTELYHLTNSSSGVIANSNVTYSGWNGSFFYSAEDLDDTGGSIGSPDGNDIKELSFSNININGATSMCFSGLFARGETDLCSFSTYDDADYIEVYYKIDSNPEIRALCFNPDLECNIPMDVSNEPLHHDPNCDGDGGEGTILTAVLTEYTFNIIGTGSSLNLRIEVHMDGGSEEIAFDYFRIRSNTALPIELSSFEAQKENHQVKLEWSTDSEINNDHFVLEHSLDGAAFNQIGKVLGAGESSERLVYYFMHANPVKGKNYYRLNQVDFDGSNSYSDIIKVMFDNSVSEKLSVMPNPFSNITNLELSSPFEKNTDINVYDLLGRSVFTDIMERDQVQKEMDLSTLKSGVYIIQMGKGDQLITQRIVKF